MKLTAADRLEGTVHLPGDKSISHRAAMIAAMAQGCTRISNFAASEDCASTLSCLEALGVPVRRSGTEVAVEGVGKTGFSKPDVPLDCGNSGTTMRLMSGILAGQGFESILTGDESLQGRPMNRIIEPLAAMNASIRSRDGRAPLAIEGNRPLTPIDYVLPVASAQIKSCVLLAGLNAGGTTTVTEPVITRDHTERMLRWFGADVSESAVGQGKRTAVRGDSVLTAKDVYVPGDVSSAAFFAVAAACLPGSEIFIENLGLNPSRTAAIEVLRDLGADFEISDDGERSGEPVGGVLVRGRSGISGGKTLEGSIIANLIDEVPILAVFGTQLDGGLEIRDAGELRVKESDRIRSVAENLRRMGASVEEFPDGLRVERSRLRGARIDSFGDHRIAMAFAIAALFAEGETEIVGAECAAVSFPDFFGVLSAAVVPASSLAA